MSGLPGNQSEVFDSGNLVTGRKRSLEQGNIFAPVCHSVHRGVCPIACWDTLPLRARGRHSPWDQAPPRAEIPQDQRQASPWTRHPPGAETPHPGTVHAGRYRQQEGGTHPTGMQYCSILFSLRAKNASITSIHMEFILRY